MRLKTIVLLLATSMLLADTGASAGALKPDCGVVKAGKSAAMKATVGVGGRCSPTDAVEGVAKDAVGIEDNGKHKDKDKGKHKGKDKDKDEKNPLKKDHSVKKKHTEKVC